MPSDPMTSEQDATKETTDEQVSPVTEDISAESEVLQTAESEGNDEDLAVELTKAQKTIKDYWDQIMRLNADMENNRKRAQRDVENAHKFAVKNFVESLLPVSDSIEMGLAASDNENANIEAIREGMSMTLNLFTQMCEKNGIQAVDPTGEKFNPEHHQAMSMQEDDSVEPNTVLNVMQKGYLLNERLIRPAMVIVSKQKS